MGIAAQYASGSDCSCSVTKLKRFRAAPSRSSNWPSLYERINWRNRSSKSFRVLTGISSCSRCCASACCWSSVTASAIDLLWSLRICCTSSSNVSGEADCVSDWGEFDGPVFFLMKQRLYQRNQSIARMPQTISP